MSSLSRHSSMSRSRSTSNACIDPLDVLIDYSGGEFDNSMSYNSPSISPSVNKTQFTRPVAAPTANNAMLSSSQQPMSGPSHQYDLYKQQTGIPTGALATTHALNQNSNMYNYGFNSGFDASDSFNDFKPSYNNIGLDLDMEFPSPSAEPAYFYPEQNGPTTEYINPSAIQDPHQMASVVPTQSGNVGRLWPGMHQQQAALAKAQAQQRQQQQIIAQQRQQSVSQPSRPRTKSQTAADPIVEEKISQLLNSMRQSSVSSTQGDDDGSQNMSAAHRTRKEEDDMDEDERLLASEEGKKLSSKERRQLRNKVSARAFRSRRKEYISQLEGEIAGKVNENTDLRNQNRALMEENTRLSDLTRMLLSSPSFSGFLDNLSTNPTAVAPSAPKVEQQPQPQSQRQVRKDVNPYAAQHQQPQMHMAIIPDQPMDFSLLDLTADAYNFQPQVFAVHELPEVNFDASILSGKKSNFVDFKSDSEKVELPIIHRPLKEASVMATLAVDDEFDNDPAFALFSNASVSSIASTPIFGGIESEKALARLELVNTSDCQAVGEAAMRKVERLVASLDSIAERLEEMTVNY